MVAVKEPAIANTSLVPIKLPGMKYGLGNKYLLVNVPQKINSFGATPEAIPPGSFSLPSRENEATARELAARTFADGLFIRGKVDLGIPTPSIYHFGTKTHKLIEESEGVVLVRIVFE